MTPADVLYWLSANVETWRPFGVVILGAIAVGALALAASAWETVSR